MECSGNAFASPSPITSKKQDLIAERNSLLVVVSRLGEDLAPTTRALQYAEQKAAEIESKYVKLLEHNLLCSVEELQKQNTLLENENARLKEEIDNLKNQILELNEEVSDLRTDNELLDNRVTELERQRRSEQQLLWAHDLLRLYTFYFSRCSWHTLTEKIAEIERSLDNSLSDEEWDSEMDKHIKQFLTSQGMPEDFPLLTLQELSNSRMKMAHTKLQKAMDQQAFIARLTPTSFADLPSNQQNAVVFLLNGFANKPTFKRMTSNS